MVMFAAGKVSSPVRLLELVTEASFTRRMSARKTQFDPGAIWFVLKTFGPGCTTFLNCSHFVSVGLPATSHGLPAPQLVSGPTLTPHQSKSAFTVGPAPFLKSALPFCVVVALLFRNRLN